MRLFRMLSIAAGLVLMVGLLTAGYVDNPNAKHADGMTIGNTYYTEPVIVTNEPNGTVNLNNMGKMKFITRPEYNLLSPVYMLRLEDSGGLGWGYSTNVNGFPAVAGFNASGVFGNGSQLSGITLQQILNYGNTATNVTLALGTLNATNAKVTIQGETGVYTDKPLLLLNRSATGTGKIQVWQTNGVEVASVDANGNFTGSASYLTNFPALVVQTNQPDVTVGGWRLQQGPGSALTPTRDGAQISTTNGCNVLTFSTTTRRLVGTNNVANADFSDAFRVGPDSGTNLPVYLTLTNLQATKLDATATAISAAGGLTNLPSIWPGSATDSVARAAAFDAAGLAALFASPVVSSQTVANAGPVTLTNAFTGTNSYWWTLTSTGTVTMLYTGWTAGRACYMDVSVYATGLPTVVHSAGVSNYINGAYSPTAPTLSKYWDAAIKRTPQTYVQIVTTNSVPPGTPQ